VKEQEIHVFISCHQKNIKYDHAAVKSVARWGYSNAIESHSHAWVKQKSYEPIDEGYLEILA